MAKRLEQLLADLPEQRRVAVEVRADNLAMLKDLRQAVEQTQQDLAATLGVGVGGTVSQSSTGRY
jgi:hypothetical protein